MSEPTFPTLNGEVQSWANIKLVCNLYDGASFDCPDIKSVKWDVSVERGMQRSINGDIKGFTRGAGTPTGSVEFYADGYQVFCDYLIKIAKSKGFVENGIAKYSLPAFDLLITHTPLGVTGIRKVEVLGCRLSKDAGEHTEGTDADVNAVELSVTKVVRTINGNRGSM